MNRGFVKLWRKTLDSGLLQNGPAWQLFGYLLLRATHKPYRTIVGGVVCELVPGEVLPSIRRHGVYATPQTVEAMLNDPETTIKILTALKEERAQRQALEARTEADRPKVVFAESIEVARTSILVGEMAKLIKQATGHDIGQNRFFEWLRDRGYLHKSGSQRNMPTQRSIDAEWMEIKEGTRIGSSGECHITRTTKITGRGQIYFVNLFAAQSRAA